MVTSSTVTGARAPSPSKKGHSDAVIHQRLDARAAFNRALAIDEEIIARDADGDAASGKARFRGGETVASLTFNLGEPLHRGFALGEGGKTSEDRIFVDHRRCPPAGHAHGFQRARPHAKIADRLAAFVAAVECLDVRAHLEQSFDEAASRRIEQHALDDNVGAGAISAAAIRNAAELGSPGTAMLAP